MKRASGERCDRRLWRMKGAERVAAVEILRSEQRAKNFGYRNRRILCCEPWFLVLYLGDLRHGVFPTDFPLVGDFPGNLAKNLDGGC